MRSSGPVFAPLLLCMTSAAPATGVELRWQGPPSCPETEFHAALARYLDPSADTVVKLEVHARVHATRGRWILDLDVVDAAGTGSRQLTAGRCETVVDAAAFVVAQAIDRSSAAPQSDPPDPTPPPEPPTIGVPPAPLPVEVPPAPPAPLEPTPPPVVEPPAPVLTNTTPSSPTRSRLRGAVRLRGGLGGVALPGVTAELGLLVGLTAARWRVDLVSLGRLPVRTDAATEPTVGARLAMWAVGPRGCGLPRIARLALPLCLGAEVGQVLGRSVGLSTEGRDASTWAAVTASPGLMWEPRHWLAFTLEFELAVALLRYDWVIRGLPPIHRIGPAQLRGFAGVEFRFGRSTIP